MIDNSCYKWSFEGLPWIIYSSRRSKNINETVRFRVSVRSFHASFPHQQCGGLPGGFFSSGFNGLCEIWSKALNQQTGVTLQDKWYRLRVWRWWWRWYHQIKLFELEQRSCDGTRDLLIRKVIMSVIECVKLKKAYKVKPSLWCSQSPCFCWMFVRPMRP